MYAPTPAGSSTEHVFSYHAFEMKTATAKVGWYNIARSGVCMLPGEVLPSVVMYC